MPQPSSTWFTQDPHWGWLIALYFFAGAVASGSYLTAALVDLVGSEADKRLARVGYLIAFPLTLIDGLLLIVDLGRPDRFVHMLWASEVGGPILKPWSPISLGAWMFGFFAAFTFLGFVRELARTGHLVPSLQRLDEAVRRTVLDRIYAAFGIVVALFMATYPGVLLAATNRPLWGDTALLATLFVVSAVAVAGAAIILVGAPAVSPAPRALAKVSGWQQAGVVATLAVLAVMLATLGPVLQVWANAWALALLVGVVLFVAALLIGGGQLLGSRSAVVGAALVLIGGFLLRFVIVLSNEHVTAALGKG